MILYHQELGTLLFYSPDQPRDDHGEWAGSAEDRADRIATEKFLKRKAEEKEKYDQVGKAACEAAIANHGETTDITKTGYILPDGRMPDMKRGTKDELLHEDIDVSGNLARGQGVVATMKIGGAIRISPVGNIGGKPVIDIGHQPITFTQQGRLGRLIDQGKGVFVSVEPNDPNPASITPIKASFNREYGPDVKSVKIFGDIKRAQRGENIQYSRRRVGVVNL